MLLTFGLLSPSKGIEQVLNALPEIVAEFPDAQHPPTSCEREARPTASASRPLRGDNLENNVIFRNSFVELKELTEYIGAADLCITPYMDAAQITSGTLAYAFGAGKAVISRLEDSHGRAIWALGTVVGRSPYWSAEMKAEQLFARALSEVRGFTSPRAWAFTLIGIQECRGRLNDDRLAKDVREELTGRLTTIFDKVTEPGWTWFEESLTYDNAKLAHALVVSGRDTGQKSVYERGIQAFALACRHADLTVWPAA